VLAHRCDWQGSGVLALHNLGPEPLRVQVAADDDAGAGAAMAELLADQGYEPAKAGQPLDLGAFGYRWLRLPEAAAGHREHGKREG
jgi:hypothetical protein